MYNHVPMNAAAIPKRKYDLLMKDTTTYYTQEKLKGIRALLYIESKRTVIYSRGGHDISRNFPHISRFGSEFYAGTILDCELHQEGVEDEIVAGWGNCYRKVINAQEVSGVKASYFDIISIRGTILTLPLLERLEILQSIIAQMPPEFTHLPTHSPSVSKDSLFKEVLSRGGEGIVLKNKYGKYEEGARKQNNWYKVKGEETFDVVITGFEMAEEFSFKKGEVELTPTKFAGLVGAFCYGMYRDGKLVELGTCSGMDDRTRVSMTNYPLDWLGKVVEVKGVEQKPSGAIDNPRFIRVRTDKEPEQCVWEKED